MVKNLTYSKKELHSKQIFLTFIKNMKNYRTNKLSNKTQDKMEVLAFLKTKLLKLFFYLIFSAFNFVYSQNGIPDNVIASSQGSTRLLIDTTRNMIIAKLYEDDFKTIADLKQILLKAENKKYLALYPIERWLLDYKLEEYSDILQTVLKFDSLYETSFRLRYRPTKDMLSVVLINYSWEFRSKMISLINDSIKCDEDKEFLKLNLNYILFESKLPTVCRDTLNKLADTFMSAFPHSVYNPYIKKHIRYLLVTSDCGVGMEVGFGIRINSGSIKNTIDEGIVFDIGVGISYKNWDCYYQMLAGPVQIQKDLPVKGKIWVKGNNGNYYNFDLSVAHNVLKNKRHRLSPSLGIALIQFTPLRDSIKNNPDLKNIEVNITNVIFGLNYQYRYPIKTRNFYFRDKPLFGCLNIRYGLSWQPVGIKLYQGFIHYVKLTWGFEVYGLKRVYLK
jgi:hypothetical protein